jgi:hypothetical protein
MTAADDAIKYALAQVGKPYKWGATGPNSFDCSGLVMMAYKSAGIKLPRTTGLMINSGASISKANLQPGDLVFPDPGHVQIYIGNNKVVEAPRTGLDVRVVQMWGFWRARRVASPGTAVGGTDGVIDVGFPNPLNGLDDLRSNVNDLLGTVKAFSNAAQWLSDPHNWLRIAMAYVGFILLVIALISAIKGSGAANGVTKIAKGVVKNGAT